MKNIMADATQQYLKVLACQIDIPATKTAIDRDTHLDRLSLKLDQELTKSPADLVVLPELSAIDYSREAFENLNDIAEQLDGPTYIAMRQIATRHKTAIVYGIARREGNDFFISQIAISPTGERLGYYDKMHICHYGASMEKDYFTKGNHLFVFECKGFKVAPIICYDIRIPELSRTLVVDQGVDFIVHCGAYFRDASFHSWHNFVITRALENQVFFLSLNRAGQTYGGSVFCPPWVDDKIQVTPFDQFEECFLPITLNRADIKETRKHYSFLDDRLENYAQLKIHK